MVWTTQVFHAVFRKTNYFSSSAPSCRFICKGFLLVMSILVSLRILSMDDVEWIFERFPEDRARHHSHVIMLTVDRTKCFRERANALYYLSCEQIAMNIRCVRLILSARRHCSKAVSDVAVHEILFTSLPSPPAAKRKSPAGKTASSPMSVPSYDWMFKFDKHDLFQNVRASLRCVNWRHQCRGLRQTRRVTCPRITPPTL